MCLCQLIGSLQKKYSIGSFELLSKTAPIQALSLLVAGPFVDYLLSGKFILNYNMSSGCFVKLLLSLWFVLFIAVHLSNLFYHLQGIHPSLMCLSCVLQHKPVPLHRAIFSGIVPGYRSHEDCVYPDTGVAPV